MRLDFWRAFAKPRSVLKLSDAGWKEIASAVVVAVSSRLVPAEMQRR